MRETCGKCVQFGGGGPCVQIVMRLKESYARCQFNIKLAQ